MHGGGRGRHEVICERLGTRINAARLMDSKAMMPMRVLGMRARTDTLETKGNRTGTCKDVQESADETQMKFLGPQRAHIQYIPLEKRTRWGTIM